MRRLLLGFLVSIALGFTCATAAEPAEKAFVAVNDPTIVHQIEPSSKDVTVAATGI